MTLIPKDHERFKNIAAGLQSLIIVTAVIVGGVWSLFTFGILGQVQRSRAELDRLQRELEEQAVLNLDMEVTQLSVPSDEGRYLGVRILIKNAGNRNARISFDKPPLHAFPVSFNEQGDLQMGNAISARPMPRGSLVLEATTVRVGQAQDHQFLICAPGPGLYWISLNLPVSAQELDILRELGTPGADKPRGSTEWGTGQFFVVQ